MRLDIITMLVSVLTCTTSLHLADINSGNIVVVFSAVWCGECYSFNQVVR